jgi:hypothetical protein
MWAGITVASLAIIAAAMVVAWRNQGSSVPAIVLSQTMPAPKLETPIPKIISGTTKIASARLNIELQHEFQNGQFSLWLDHKLICERELHSQAKRHALFFKKIQAESIPLTVPAGEHWLEIRVESSAAHYDQSKKIIESFDRAKENILHVDCDREKNSLEVTI